MESSIALLESRSYFAGKVSDNTRVRSGLVGASSQRRRIIGSDQNEQVSCHPRNNSASFKSVKREKVSKLG